MRFEPIRDPDGDRILAAEEADRALERADSPLTHMNLERTRKHLELLADLAALPSVWGDDR